MIPILIDKVNAERKNAGQKVIFSLKYDKGHIFNTS